LRGKKGCGVFHFSVITLSTGEVSPYLRHNISILIVRQFIPQAIMSLFKVGVQGNELGFAML